MHIYILQLQDECYYIGKTDNIEKRSADHMSGNGSAWTRLHKPLKVLSYIESSSDFDEDKYTKEYMVKFGIEKVRGGSYVKLELDAEQKRSLQRELWGAQNRCFHCGREHFVKDCIVSTPDFREENSELIEYMQTEYTRLCHENHYIIAKGWKRAIDTICKSEYIVEDCLEDLEGSKFPYIGEKFSIVIREFYD